MAENVEKWVWHALCFVYSVANKKVCNKVSNSESLNKKIVKIKNRRF